MDFTTKCARALSLGGALSLILLTTTFQVTGIRESKAQTTLTEMSRPTYSVGYQYLSVNEKGEEITTTLTAQTDKTRTWKRSNGCVWITQTVDPKSSTKWGFAPTRKWTGCGITDGAQESRLDGGQPPYPLKVGNWWGYSIDGSTVKGGTWSDNRTCKVHGVEKVTIALGDYDTFKVVCEQKRSTRTYYMSPELGLIKYKNYHTKRGTTSWELKKIVSTGSAQ